MNPLILTHKHIEELIDYPTALELTRQALLEWCEAPDQCQPRQRVHVGRSRVSVHPGGSRGQGVFGALMHCELLEVRNNRQEMVNNPEMLVLYSVETGEVIAIICGRPAGSGGIVDIRTAAISVLGTKLLARPDAAVVGMLGSGVQAVAHIKALASAFSLREVRVYSPTKEHREKFARTWADRLALNIRSVSSSEEAISGSDVVVCVTNTTVPVFDGRELKPGMHVTTFGGSNAGLVRSGVAKVKRREIDDETMRRADVLSILSRAQAVQDQQGEVYDPAESGVVNWDNIVELRDVVAGRAVGRTKPSQITVFMNNAGGNIVDITLAGYVYNRAVELGLGVRIDPDRM